MLRGRGPYSVQVTYEPWRSLPLLINAPSYSTAVSARRSDMSHFGTWAHACAAAGRRVVAALAERGRRKAPHFPSGRQAEPTRSATASTVAPGLLPLLQVDEASLRPMADLVAFLTSRLRLTVDTLPNLIIARDARLEAPARRRRGT